MSNQTNEELLEKAASAIDLAAKYREEFTHTPIADMLEMEVNFVTQDIEDNNLDDLYNVSLPSLQGTLSQCNDILANEAREAIYGSGDIY